MTDKRREPVAMEEIESVPEIEEWGVGVDTTTAATPTYNVLKRKLKDEEDDVIEEDDYFTTDKFSERDTYEKSSYYDRDSYDYSYQRDDRINTAERDNPHNSGWFTQSDMISFHFVF